MCIRDRYFSYYGSGDTNLLSSSLYNTMTGVSSSSNIKVTSVSGNAVSSMKIDSIERLATACTVKTAGTVTGTPVGSGADMSQFTNGDTYSFSATLDGVNRTITFTAGANDADTIKNINQALYRNFGTAVGMKYTAGTGSDKGTMELVQLDAAGNLTDVPVDSSRLSLIHIFAHEIFVNADYDGVNYGPNDLLDQRNTILDDLSRYGKLEVISLDQGRIQVKLGGKLVVDANGGSCSNCLLYTSRCV